MQFFFESINVNKKEESKNGYKYNEEEEECDENNENDDKYNENNEKSGDKEEECDENNEDYDKYNENNEKDGDGDVIIYQKEKYVKKKMNEKEYSILTTMSNEEHFPTILGVDKINKNTIIMPFYESKKITYEEEMDFVKKYIKSLLLSIKKLNEKKYVHGDIKPNNFLYNNENEYWLIDFDSSYNATTSASHSSTFPFIPPERNCYIVQYSNKFDFRSDLWSVGIILLCFMAKKQLFQKVFKLNNNQRLNELCVYIKLYGISKLGLQLKDKALISGKVTYIQNFIERNCVRGGDKAIDLIKKLLELDVTKRINVEEALNHSFFDEGEYSKYCLSLFNKKNFLKLT